MNTLEGIERFFFKVFLFLAKMFVESGRTAVLQAVRPDSVFVSVCIIVFYVGCSRLNCIKFSSSAGF